MATVRPVMLEMDCLLNKGKFDVSLYHADTEEQSEGLGGLFDTEAQVIAYLNYLREKKGFHVKVVNTTGIDDLV